MDKKMRYEVDWHKSGQVRPYADSVYEATIRIFDGETRRSMSADYVKHLAKILVHEWVANPEWHQPRITNFIDKGNEWTITVTLPFLD